jgi:type II secretion system protein N
VVARRRQLILHTLAYTLYGVVVFVVLLYILFPYELLRQRVVERFLRDDLRLAITSLRPDFPPGVQLRQVRLLTTSAASTETLAQVETLRMQPDVVALLSKTLDIRFDARLYNGRFEGNIHTAVAEGESLWELQARFSDLQVEQHPLAQKDTKAFLRGRLEGDVNATLDNAGLLQQGLINLRMQPLVFMGNEGLQLQLSRDITCDSLQSQLRFAAGQLQIISFNCRGEDLSIVARGSVQWQQPLGESTLELQVQMRSETTFKQEIDLIGTLIRRRPDRRGVLSFNIRGTLQQPRFGA